MSANSSILTRFPSPERRRWGFLPPIAVAFLLAAACTSNPDGIDPSEVFDELLGGETTAFSDGGNAFELSARNLPNEQRRIFEVGDSFFNQNWVTAPASTDARDGLGPTFNALSCSSCHSHDGRGKPPDGDGDPERGLLFRLSVPGPDGPSPEPAYGGQLQDRAIISAKPEGRMVVRYEEIEGAYADGTPYSLRRPAYSVEDLAFGPMSPGVMISPRVAPAIIGMGLLEAVPAETILTRADPEDHDGDGISGRPNMVWDVRSQSFVLGRFGWKANQPSVEQQVAGAFNGDIGITSVLFPEENCPAPQSACASAPSGGSPELTEDRLNKVALYSRTLAVPAMRNAADPTVLKGAELFVATGCSVCHTPMHVTGDHTIDALSGQTIYPYTDLLLHDMGEGLSDNRPDFEARGVEWRTPPLWGIGLVEEVNGHTMFLHDGRARNLAEAILWHDGEAAASKDGFVGLSKDERDALVFFLESI